MDAEIILPTMPTGANVEAIEAAAETAERLGWRTAWTTDHLIVPQATAAAYAEVFELIVTLAHIGARQARLRLGTSVIVVPMRNALIVAKELATLDALTRGRVIAGIGVGWNEVEFATLGASDVFHRRGAYLDESIRLWRHLWSGATTPFHGRFFSFDDFTFGPLPPQGAALPIVVGGRAEPALRRAGALADGYHGSSASPADFAERVPIVRAAAAAAGRPAPWFSGRVNVRFDGAPGSGYAMTGSPDEMVREVQAFAAEGVTEIGFAFGETDAERTVRAMERFDRDVLAALR